MRRTSTVAAFLWCATAVIYGCENVYVHRASYRFLDGLYTPNGDTCTGGHSVYVRHVQYSSGGAAHNASHIRSVNNSRWKLGIAACGTGYYNRGSISATPYDGDWVGLITVTCMDNAVHLSGPGGSSWLDATKVSTLLDGNTTTCLTLPRSRLSPGIVGSWYQFYLRIPLFSDTRLKVIGAGFSCSVPRPSECGAYGSRHMALSKLRYDSCPACGEFQEYHFAGETTSSGMTTCKFTTSCGDAGCLGVLFTLGYEDFLGEDVQLCDLRFERL